MPHDARARARVVLLFFFLLNNPQRRFFNPTQRGILIDELSAVCQVCQEIYLLY